MKKRSFLSAIFLFFLFANSYAQYWVQKGNDIDGPAPGSFAGCGVSMNASGSIVAVGGFGNSAMTGKVQIFQWSGTAWVQMGSDINGTAFDNWTGYSVGLSADGYTVAVGSIRGDAAGIDAGHTSVYTWSGSSWVQKGVNINGEAADDLSGCSVSLSADGNTLAIGAYNNDGGGSNSGHARVYTWSGSAWVQKGLDLNGEAAGDLFGHRVCLSDNGNTIAVGATNNDGNGTDAGHVRVFTWSGSAWVQKGTDIDGDGASYFAGNMSINGNGNVLAVGAPGGGASGEGQIKIFEWSGSAWVQKGLALPGEAAGDNFGGWVSLNNAGDMVSAGAVNNDGSYSNAGHTRIFTWNGSFWAQKGLDIDGEAADDNAGWPVELNAAGTRIIIGAVNNDGGGNSSGQARVYEYCTATSSVMSLSACNSYTSPSGSHVWTLSGTYTDTIPNFRNCDSIITIHLTVTSVGSVISPSTCNSYTSPSGNYTWTTSGTYTDTIYAAVGCDSIITIHLTVNETSSSTISPVACDSYVSPSGHYTWNLSGMYTDTLTNAEGCDSMVTVNLTITHADTALTINNGVLTATASGAAYQWLSCGSGQVIAGETGQLFTPVVAGYYALIITENGCTDTSACYAITPSGVGLEESNIHTELFPNPASGPVQINLGAVYPEINLRVINALGQVFSTATYYSTASVQIELPVHTGVYWIELITPKGEKTVIKAIKK